MSNIVRGTMLLTGATFLSKFLGMIYVVPFNEMVGPTGGALFQAAYNPYSIFISISTVGIPLAVSKFVSKYNSLGDYETSMRMFKAGITLMAVTGFLAFLTLFFGAELVAKWTLVGEDSQGMTIPDVTQVIRMVSFALLLIPAMSIMRGFFQGYESMGPTAVSQVMEQIVRIAFLLGSTFVVLKLLGGTISSAVSWATFSAFIGALASCLVLLKYWRRRKPKIEQEMLKQSYSYDIPTRNLFKELFRYAGPFVLVGLAIPLYQLVDQFTFKRAMMAIGRVENFEIAWSTINFYAHKLIIIPVTIATGLSLAILPALTKTFTQNNRPLLYQQINQALQIVLVLVIPASIGLLMLSDVAYGSLFGLKDIDIKAPLLAWYAPVALLFALFTVSSAILQGINQQRFAVISLSAGLLLKVLLNIQLIHVFGAKGAIFGTALAAGTAVSLNIWRVRVSIDFPLKQTFKRTMLIGIFSIIMVLALWLVKWLFGLFLPYESSRFASTIVLFFCVLIGGGIYLGLSYYSTLLERIFGNKIRKLDLILRRGNE